MRSIVCCVILLLAFASRAYAQSDSVLTSVLLGPQDDKSQVDPGYVAFKQPVGAIRLGASSGGFMLGMVIGGYAGSQVLYQDCDNCKKAKIDALVVGGGIGGALGAAFGAALLELSSVCTRKDRVMRSLIGASVGGAALFAAGGGLHRGGRTVFLVPIGAVSGSLGSLGRCWKTRA